MNVCYGYMCVNVCGFKRLWAFLSSCDLCQMGRTQPSSFTDRLLCVPPQMKQAKSVGNSGLVDKLEADARLMSYQAQVTQRLEVSRDS